MPADRRHRQPGVDKALVRESFSRAAPGYDRWATLQRRIGDRLLARLDPDLDGAATVLDLGSGTGHCSRQLSRKGLSVVALDLAPGMLANARASGEHETRYLCADAESLPLRDRLFDVVFSNLMMQWCRDLERLAAEVHRVLKPGGIFLFSTFGPKTLCELREAWRRVDPGSHVNEFADLQTIRDSMSGTGWGSLSIAREALGVEYDGVLELMRELKGIGAHNLTPGRPRALTGKHKVRKMIEEYESLSGGPVISATFELIVGRCVRVNARRIGQDAA